MLDPGRRMREHHRRRMAGEAQGRLVRRVRQNAGFPVDTTRRCSRISSARPRRSGAAARGPFRTALRTSRATAIPDDSGSRCAAGVLLDAPAKKATAFPDAGGALHGVVQPHRCRLKTPSADEAVVLRQRRGTRTLITEPTMCVM